jgi:hypothetical protein
VDVTVGVWVGSGVEVAVGDTLAVQVGQCVSVGRRVWLGKRVSVEVGSSVGVRVGGSVGTGVEVGTGVTVCVTVGARVAVRTVVGAGVKISASWALFPVNRMTTPATLAINKTNANPI